MFKRVNLLLLEKLLFQQMNGITPVRFEQCILIELPTMPFFSVRWTGNIVQQLLVDIAK